MRNSGVSGLLGLIRCPDCRERSAVLDGRCTVCSRDFIVASGVLDARPKTVPGGSSKNSTYYDCIACDGRSVLSRRAYSRNANKKLHIVMESLQLARSLAGDVLEIGVGFGSHGSSIVEMGHRYVGVDIALASLIRARERHPSLEEAGLVAAEGTNLPFRDSAFDKVFCVATLHHLVRPEEGTREMIRVLKPGGSLCIIEPRAHYPTQLWQVITNPGVERSGLRVTERSVPRWLRRSGQMQAISIARHIFTPNRPSVLSRVFDSIDDVCERSPWLSLCCAVMFTASGVKNEW